MSKCTNREDSLQLVTLRLRSDQLTALKQFTAGKRSQLVRNALDLVLFLPDLVETIEKQIQREIDVRKSLGILGHERISPTAMTKPLLSLGAHESGGSVSSHSIMTAAGVAAQPALASTRESSQLVEKQGIIEEEH